MTAPNAMYKMKPDLNQFDCIMFDCDGVLWRSKKIIEGSSLVVKTLQDQGKSVYFLSNNSGIDREQYVAKLASFDIDATVDDVIASGYATAEYLKEHHHQGKVYVIAQEGAVKELIRAGFDCLHADEVHNGNIPREKLDEMDVDRTITAVVVGWDVNFNYLKMAYASWLLYKQPNVRFISTNRDPMYPSTSRFLPGAGTVVSGVATAAQRKPFNIGKPEPYMFEIIKRKRAELDPQRCLMIGDNLLTDIEFGARSGVQTLLVLTGVSTLDDLASSSVRPDYVIDSVASLLH